MLNKKLLHGFFCLILAIAGSACAASGDAERDKSAQAAGATSNSGGDARNADARAERSETANVDKDSPAAAVTPETAAKKSPNDAAESDDEIRHLEPFDFTVIKDWLKTRPNLRVLREADYGAKRLTALRELEANPKIHPFYITGDFNRDGTREFAVMLVSRKNRNARAVAVFDTPPVTREKNIKPTFFLGDIKDAGGNLILHAEDEGGIYVGESGTDSGFYLAPTGKTYKVTDPFADEN